MRKVDERATKVSPLHTSPLRSSIFCADALGNGDSYNSDGVLGGELAKAFKIRVTVNAVIALAGEAHRR